MAESRRARSHSPTDTGDNGPTINPSFYARSRSIDSSIYANSPWYNGTMDSRPTPITATATNSLVVPSIGNTARASSLRLLSPTVLCLPEPPSSVEETASTAAPAVFLVGSSYYTVALDGPCLAIPLSIEETTTVSSTSSYYGHYTPACPKVH